MTGMIASARPMPAVTALRRNSKPNNDCTQDAITMRTKKPITTDGTPASNSIIGLIHSRSAGGANSAVYNAARSASGGAVTMAINVTLNVPRISGKTLYLGTPDTGCQIKGSVNGDDREMPSVDCVSNGKASRAT